MTRAEGQCRWPAARLGARRSCVRYPGSFTTQVEFGARQHFKPEARKPLNHRRANEMASNEAIELAEFLAKLRTGASDPRLDLPTIRDIIDTVHLATKEPEDVSYVETNVGG